MAKSRLADILKQEYKTKGVVGGAVSAVGKSLKEKMDFRNILFGGSGVGSIVGRKIFGKGYTASPESSVVSKITSPEQTFSSEAVTVLSTIATHSATSAKNSIVLPSMARDMHLVKQNIAKLVRMGGETPQTRSGDWLNRQMARETAYEESLKKAPTPLIGRKDVGEKKSSNPIMAIFAAFGLSLLEIAKNIGTLLKNIITKAVNGIASLLGSILSGPGFIGALAAAAIAALYKEVFYGKEAKDFRRAQELAVKENRTPEEQEELEQVSERVQNIQKEATTNYGYGEFGGGMEALGMPEYNPPTENNKPLTKPTPVSSDGLTLLNKVMDKEGVKDTSIRERITNLAMTESSMNPNAKGPTIQSGMHKGDQARGLLQIMPKTAPEVGFSAEDLNDPEKAATAGVKYFLKNLKRFNGNLDAATVAHHAGPGAGDKFVKNGNVETRDVATGISTMGYLNKVSGMTLASASTSAVDGQRRLASAGTTNVNVDNSVKNTNMNSPQTVQVASAYNEDFTRLLQQVAGV